MSRDRHGGDIHAAARDLARPLGRLMDFSASINPLGPPPGARRAAVAALRHIEHYPDPQCAALKAALASRWHLPSSHLLIGNGSSELIALLPRALAIRSAVVLGPTYSEYARAIEADGGRVVQVNAPREDGYRPPWQRIQHILKAGRAIDALYLCNPNNPTGRSVSKALVLELIRTCARKARWIIVDESFVEYAAACSVLTEVRRQPHLVVLRSFTKFYALTGLRIGYAAAPSDTIARLQRHQAPWSVNTPAQEAAIRAMADCAYARRSLLLMRRERAGLAAALRSIRHMVVFPSAANFLLAELPEGRRATPLVAALRRRGVLIRDCSNVPGLNDRTIRIAVRRPGENRRLVSVLRACLGGG